MHTHHHVQCDDDDSHQVVFVRSPFNYNVAEASRASGLTCPEATLAQQQFKDETDINVIVHRFGLTGELPTNGRMPTYDDFTGVGDYHTALNALRSAEEAFMALPGHVRDRFNHDPQRFVEFCSDDANIAAARELGLVPNQPAPLLDKPILPADLPIPAPRPAAPPAV
ncbi:MAG: internal scaffolding protein [Microvirus sp.]|nr:MAG: internal scaffolding protein [Microvirus sp.]